MDSLSGQVLDKKYRVDKKLGQGGMGAVYLAQHLAINKTVAIKVLLPDAANDSDQFERFKREAEATARIKHPNIVPVLDFGQSEDGLLFMVMDYVQGYSLRSLLDSETKLAPKHAVKFICQICAAIAAAHNVGIIHRDIKPDNIMIEIVDGYEVARVLDFGIAKLKDAQQLQLTAVGGAIGTPAYMSPEQCLGLTVVDARADIYSIGIMLYQMLSGCLPFQATDRIGLMVQQVSKPPQPLIEICPELPTELAQVVMQTLEKEPQNRQQSANELSEQLKTAINSSSLINSIYGSAINLTSTSEQFHSETSTVKLVTNESSAETILDNKYRLIRLLGQGGMGAVFLAQHIAINKTVAIKVLLADTTNNPDLFERFKREAEATARIKHPNIVPVLDFGQTEDGQFYMVMEYVQGYSLRKLLQRRQRLSAKKVIALGRQICAAIAAAHSVDIVHRDIKPDNIMIEIVDGYEVARVLDFGIAKLKDAQQLQLTVAGGAIGTPAYMSPEQCSGDNIDARTDIYSIGIMLYQMLSGNLPFQANDGMGFMIEHLSKPPQPLDEICPELPIELVRSVMQALEKDPLRRQQSTSQLSEQLKAASGNIISLTEQITIVENSLKVDKQSTATSEISGINKRFTMNRCLGSGAFGSVYEAQDKLHNTVVALKMLKQADAEQIYHFKREFRSLTDIIHPNLVTLYELLSDGEQWFFTMQMVQGIDFLKWVKGDRSISDIDRLRVALKQLVEGISALHRAGKLHRDIKPSNVLVTSEGCVVILDFGLVMESSIQENIGQVAGTPAYMSPEQAAGLPVSEASDWYCVGAMLYQALTGSLPITGNNAMELLINKQKFDPIAPSAKVAGIPADLDQLCLQLLKREVADRPRGSEILAILNNSAVAVSETATPSFPAPPFIGRENQLNDLHKTYQDVKAGKSGIAFVKGYSGMGKSVLVRHFLDEIKQDEPNTVILMGRCYEQETVPYKALDSVIDSLTRYLKSLSQTEVATIIPVNVLALARLFPVLKQIEAVASANRSVLDIPDLQELRQKAFAAFRELVTRLAINKRLIIFIDDYQWSDFDSTSLLHDLIRPPDVPQIFLICSYRAEEAETNAILQQLISLQTYQGANITISNITVKELSEDEARTVIISLLGENNIDSAVVNRIIRESGGNPFFLYELAQYYQTQQNDLANLPDSNNILTIEKVLRSRIGQLSEKARKLLEMVAVSGQPLERHLAKLAAELTADEQLLAALRTNRFIRILKVSDKEELETYHDKIRETTILTIETNTLPTLHEKLAAALESSSNPDPERLLYHCRTAGDNNRAIKYALIAGGSANQALAFDRAAQHYKAAIGMITNNDEELQEVYTKLARAQVNAGRGADSATSYLSAAKLAGSKDPLELQRRAAEQLLLSGHIDEGVVILRKLLDGVGISWPQTSISALAPLLANRLRIWLRGTNFQECNETEIPSKLLFQIDICASLAIGLGQADPLRGNYFNTKHLLLALKAGEPNRIIKAINMEIGFTSILKESRKYTQTLFKREQEIAERLNHPYAFGLVSLSEGYIAFQQGQWQLAQSSLEKAERIFRENCTGVAWEMDTAKYFTLCALQFMGKLQEVYQRLPGIIMEAKDRSDLFLLILSRARYSSIQCLMADEPNKAIDEVDLAMEQWSHGGFHHQHYVGLNARASTYLYRDYGKGNVAYEYIKKQWTALKDAYLLVVQVIRIEAYHTRANSALAAALTDQANSKSLLLEAERDVKKIEREDLTYGKGIAMMIRAGIAATRGRVPEAIKLLISAEAVFNKADMALHVAIVNRRRGELMGDRALIKSADNWMTGQQIKNPARLTAMFAPGNYAKKN